MEIYPEKDTVFDEQFVINRGETAEPDVPEETPEPGQNAETDSARPGGEKHRGK